MSTRIASKRIYAPSEPGDGCRVLVDRIWPRGVRKADAAIDHWLKDVAPSKTLRQWFGHDPERFAEFRRRYQTELDNNRDAVDELIDLARQNSALTLIYAARDSEHNHAVVLADYLQQQLESS
ncbi:uncharacterized protein YeaO (DUF488 family) [Methylohalomonas lacus]|uniref:Uncharacterized protein YeaO (DUF488 family) n=1 Tax=Methylohalomonas lacus TaxID=398773 RepID=A0AAE3HJ37_9GAMM|nr:uncharacterized protein YeaO (DUF488 family) [Methylohalomonas lacus]